jgi:hypothetical protein
MSRCVHCSTPKRRCRCALQVLQTGALDLPPGKSCSDCIHFRRCSQLISTAPDRTSCDWFPVRFVSPETLVSMRLVESCPCDNCRAKQAAAC